VPARADPTATADTLTTIQITPFMYGVASGTKKSSVGTYAAQMSAKILDGLVQLLSCTLPTIAINHITKQRVRMGRAARGTIRRLPRQRFARLSRQQQ